MKTCLKALSILALFTSSVATAAVYQWTDANGVTNFTDDPNSIPNAYRSKAIRRETDGKVKPGTPATQIVPAQRTPAPSPPAPGAESSYGGHVRGWWTERFRTLQEEIRALKEGLDQKQAQLVELRRRRAIFMRARDREAVNSAQAAIDADTAHLADLENQLKTLTQTADEALVPAEWRR